MRSEKISSIILRKYFILSEQLDIDRHRDCRNQTLIMVQCFFECIKGEETEEAIDCGNWYYDKNKNAIVFKNEYVPEIGDRIEITYTDTR